MVDLYVEKFIAETKPLHNHIGIYDHTELVRLIGIGEDDSDFHYIFLQYNGKKIVRNCIFCFISLKDIYPNYEDMDELFEFNGGKKTEEFLNEICP